MAVIKDTVLSRAYRAYIQHLKSRRGNSMMKEVTIKIEVCDICQEREVEKHSHGTAIKCEICGKILCSGCTWKIAGLLICPDCKNTEFSEYFALMQRNEELTEELETNKELMYNELKRIRNLAKF